MIARVKRARPLLAAWLFATAVMVATVATALAGDGGAPFGH